MKTAGMMVDFTESCEKNRQAPVVAVIVVDDDLRGR
jgi:hypothetical protein